MLNRCRRNAAPGFAAARHIHLRLRQIRTIISSICQTPPADARLRRMFAAIAGPNLSDAAEALPAELGFTSLDTGLTRLAVREGASAKVALAQARALDAGRIYDLGHYYGVPFSASGAGGFSRAAQPASGSAPRCLARIAAGALNLGDPGRDETYGFGYVD